jgi:hypothetical protein
MKIAFSNVLSYSHGICRWQIQMRARIAFRWHVHIHFASSDGRLHILMPDSDSHSDGTFRFTLIFMWHIKLCFHIQMAYSDGLFKCMFVSHSDGIFHIAYYIFIFIWHIPYSYAYCILHIHTNIAYVHDILHIHIAYYILKFILHITYSYSYGKLHINMAVVYSYFTLHIAY